MPDDTNQQDANGAQQQAASGFPAPAPTLPVDNVPAPTPGTDVAGGVDSGMGTEQPAVTPGTEVQPSPDANAPLPGVPGADVPPTDAGQALPPQPNDDNTQPQQ